MRQGLDNQRALRQDGYTIRWPLGAFKIMTSVCQRRSTECVGVTDEPGNEFSASFAASDVQLPAMHHRAVNWLVYIGHLQGGCYDGLSSALMRMPKCIQ